MEKIVFEKNFISSSKCNLRDDKDGGVTGILNGDPWVILGGDSGGSSNLACPNKLADETGSMGSKWSLISNNKRL